MGFAAGEERAEVARATGQVYRDQLDDPRAAIRAYEVAFEIDENDASTMDALEALYRDNDRLEALRALLERRAIFASNEDRIAMQLRLAQLYEQAFRDQDAAIDMFRQVLLANPNHEVANADLDRLYQATGAWDELIALLLSRAAHATDEAQRGLLARVAELHLGKRNDEDATIFIYERINTDLGADEDSLRALAGLYERKGSWTRVADTLERLVGRLGRGSCHRAFASGCGRLGTASRRCRTGGTGFTRGVRAIPTGRGYARATQGLLRNRR